jgi:thiol-disulfide isomerase/thioredoxin
MAVRLPGFDGATAWVNTAPLDRAGLRGKVVLVNFWTLTCINWLRQEPYVRAWARAYGDDGLVVVGVHTPEFGFEHDVEGVRRAVAEREIDYPVAVDDGYAIWDAFANRYWPALYFADREGVLRDEHFGEGRYDASEETLRRLLGVDGDRPRVTPGVEGAGPEAMADWDHLRTPETYLGAGRGERRSATAPEALALNAWTTTGAWQTEGERVVLDGGGGEDGSGTLAFRFHARDAHLVARPSAAPAPYRVLLDGEPPGDAHGVDVGADGYGLLDAGRLHQLIRQPGAVRERLLEVQFPEGGAEAYAFTFG